MTHFIRDGHKAAVGLVESDMGQEVRCETTKHWLVESEEKGWPVALEWLLYGKILWDLEVTQRPFLGKEC